MGKDEIILINLSGRGDKDVDEVRKILAERQDGSKGRAH
jgi:tryptophan synthase beta subunit